MKIEYSSFRDPDGFVFYKDNCVYRQINASYFPIYYQLKKDKVVESLQKERLLIKHEETYSDDNKIIIKPEAIPFISYPYEWSFSQLKDAALLTLKLQKSLINSGFSLKDASAYNVQFIGYEPIFIDTLSIEFYKEEPWVAFGQFCKHFLYPLMLMSKVDLRLNNLFKLWINGIPADIVDELLPFNKYFSLTYWFYIKLLNRAQAKHQSARKKISAHLSKNQLIKLLDGLTNAIKNLKPKGKSTEWGDYYNFTNYTEEAFAEKKKIVKAFIDEVNPKMVWDLGANNGYFSRLASEENIPTLAFDIDPIAVEKNYRSSKYNKENFLLPLLLDLTNPSSNIGWGNNERVVIERRGQADLCMALALVHHLAIGNNVPFIKIAEFFSKLCNNLIVEFIPKEDSKVQELLLNRKDVFSDYTQENFEKSFSKYFSIQKSIRIEKSLRTLYLLRNLR